MQVHHQQGVELAMIVRDATDDPDVRLLAYDIATTQAQQAGQMYGWLAEWDLSQAGSEPSMTWMTPPADGRCRGRARRHGGDASARTPASRCPGSRRPSRSRNCESADGRRGRAEFLELMIAHHQGAVEMASSARARSRDAPR